MTTISETYAAWLAAAADNDQTLGERYLGEGVEMLNADQVAEVANKLLREYAAESGAADAPGEWQFVRGGTTMVEIARGDAAVKVERFCGGWPLDSEKTADLLARLDA